MIFSFYHCPISVKSKNSLPTHISRNSKSISQSQKFSPPIPSSRFIVLAFTFSSVTHLELFYIKGVRFRWKLFFSSFGCLTVPASFGENTYFPSISLLLHPCQKSIGCIYASVFLVSVFFSTSLCLHQCHTVSISFSCLIVVSRFSNTMNKRGESRHSCLVVNLRGDHSVLHD